MTKFTKTALIITAIIIFSCTYLNQRLYIKTCKFSLVKVDVRKFGLTGLTLGLHVMITNPNAIEVRIDKMDFDLYIEDKKTVMVTFGQAAIEPNKAKTVVAALVIPYRMLGMSLVGNLKTMGKINYKLAGEVGINTPLGAVSVPVIVSEN
jgi:LEA14-like dessication related protein